MTQPAVNSEQVAALFAERQRYESWLGTLESKRATTPPHIYHRVHADYTARLQRVIEQLSTHRAVLQEIEGTLVDRLTSLDIEEAKQRDEAAEAELRSLVGELSAEHHREVKARTDAAIAASTAEREQLADELSRLRAVLEAAGITSEPARGTHAERPAAPTPPATPLVAEAAPPPAQPAVPVQPRTSGAVHPPAPVAATRTDDWDLSLEQVPEPQPPAPPAAPPRRSGPASVDGARPAEPGPFDDLEFLKTMIDPRRSGESVAVGSGVPSGGDRAQAEGGAGAPPSPPAARSSAAVPRPAEPAVAREAVEQVKTLKCQECGTLNYPTEWYCERCGAELAAL